MFSERERELGSKPTKEDVRQTILVACGKLPSTLKEEQDDIYHVWRLYIKSVSSRNMWSWPTWRRHEALRRHMEEYRPVWHISSLKEQDLVGFVNYMSSTAGLKNTTIAKNVSILRQFLAWSKQNGHYNGDLYNFHPKIKGGQFEGKEVVYLTIDELRRIEELEIEPFSTADIIRDMFVLCCYSGLRYSDASKLTWTDVHDDHISIVTQKTSESIIIPINNHSRRILEKYRLQSEDSKTILPHYSNKHANVVIKEVAKAAEIDSDVRVVYWVGTRRVEEVHPKHEIISTHCARRTFVVTALQLGVDPLTITKITGHSDIKAMKPYIAVVDDMKKKAMDRFNDL